MEIRKPTPTLNEQLSTLRDRREKIDKVLDNISRFPKVGADTVIDRSLAGLSGVDYLNGLIDISRPQGVLEKTKYNLVKKTAPALRGIGFQIGKEIVRIDVVTNFETVKGLVDQGRLPEKYLEKAQAELDKAQKGEEAPDDSQKAEEQQVATVNNPMTSGEVRESEDLSDKTEHTDVNDIETEEQVASDKQDNDFQEIPLVEQVDDRDNEEFSADPVETSSNQEPSQEETELAEQQEALGEEPSQENADQENQEVTSGNFEIKSQDGVVVVNGKEIELDPSEMRILKALYGGGGLWLKTQDIADDFFTGKRSLFSTKLGTLRRKLNDDAFNPTYIISSGIGRLGGNYRFAIENISSQESQQESESSSSGEGDLTVTDDASVETKSEAKSDANTLVLPGGEFFIGGKMQRDVLGALIANSEKGLDGRAGGQFGLEHEKVRDSGHLRR